MMNTGKIYQAKVKFQSKLDVYIEKAKDLVLKLLCKDPENRISTDAALKHPWIQVN